jgi:hypothetical protein
VGCSNTSISNIFNCRTVVIVTSNLENLLLTA